MGIMNEEEYKDSLKALKPTVYHFGKKIDNIFDDPIIVSHINAAGETYKAAFDPESTRLATANSHLAGEKINRFTHIHQSVDDLIKKVKLLRMLGQRTGTCFQRCVGLDGLSAVYSTTFEMDRKLGTDYHKRFIEYLKYVQSKDLMLAGSMTDPKGDRSKKPSEQRDKDMFLRIVKKNSEGIIVNGAKMHQTGIVNSHEILVMPTQALKEGDKDYAVSIAIPVDAKGVIHIFGRQTNDLRRYQENNIDVGNKKYGVVGGEALTIFDNVFVPWDRVFMCGETDYAKMLVYLFATYHRQNYGACKTGLADVLIGASALAAEYNGVEKASHIKDKLAEMIHLTETLYCASVACSAEGIKLSSNAYFPSPLLANVSKHNITRFIYEIFRISHDIAGGYIATMPSENDLCCPEISGYIEKYLKGSTKGKSINRIRIGRLIENMTGGTAQVESMHGAGSPQAQRIMYLREANIDIKKKLAEKLSGIKED
ncbi:MAG: 4-hydroxyphenylacetate 3-hydroxylase family protein [Deferribacterota bacterium]|nr:4-hydroxyphenylacetate 3-hydroxylase family protein [Deferribacterota bacterium]